MDWQCGAGRSTRSHVSGEMLLSAEALAAGLLGADKLRGIVVFAEQLHLGAGRWRGSAWLCRRCSAWGRPAAEYGRHEVRWNGLSIHHEYRRWSW